MPCPKSHFPVSAVILPSAPITSHVSSLESSTCGPFADDSPFDCARNDVGLNVTISAPQPFRKSRRDGIMFPRVGILPYRSQHSSVREAAAQHATQSVTNLDIGCVRIHIQHGFSGQDDAAQTKSALCRSLINERLLQRMRLVCGAQAIECGDLA